MAAFVPFQPDVKGGSAGFSQVLVIGSAGAQTNLQFNQPSATALLVTGVNTSPSGSIPAQAYIRMSVESSTAIATNASAADTAFVMVAQQSPTVRLFSSPNPGGKYNVTVFVTISPSLGGSQWQLWFSPGQGGVA